MMYMMTFKLVWLMILLGAVNNHPITLSDLNSVQNVVSELQKSKDMLETRINEIKKAQNTLEETIDTELALIRKAKQDVKGWTDMMEKRFDNEVNETFARYILNRQHTFNHFARQAYLTEAAKQMENIAAIRDKHYVYLRKFHSGILSIRDSNNRIARVTTNKIESFGKEVNKTAERRSSQGALENLGDELYLLSRQVQLQQFNEYEKARSDGNTGIKQIRSFHVGSENYYSNDHNGKSIAGIHNKEYTKNKLGIGEFVAVMNGIEFKTGSHDYELKQPSKTQKTFHQTEPIQFPSPPLSVTSKADVFDQIIEMRKLFKSFQYGDDDESVKHYFKPVLSYLEGAWLFGSEESNTKECQYDSYVGRERYTKPYLPTSILGFTEDKKPQYATWDYRILAHQLTSYVSPSLFQPIYDPVSLRRHKWKNNLHTPTQRYDIFGVDLNTNRKHHPIHYSYIDSLMEQIPGKDNYVGSLQATGYEATITSADDQKSLNGAFYHRVYKLESIDAMGVTWAQKSFSDVLYVAESSHENVAGLSYTNDKKEKILANASYAMPMEIIYLTPLAEWNPFEIPHKDDCNQINGDGSVENPFDATCPDRFFRTPQAFFSDATSFDCLPNINGEVAFYFRSALHPTPVCLVGSGVRIILPPIPSIGEPIRQRYPIMPVNGEGSSVWKKLNAIQDSLILLNVLNEEYTFEIGESSNARIKTHTHEIVVTKSEMRRLENGKSVKKLTEAKEGQHQHILTLKLSDGGVGITIYSCDTDSGDDDTFCFDQHKNFLIRVGVN